MITTEPRTCRECLKALPASMKANSEFCSSACRVAWRNRRMSRGADLYDCFMALRYDRPAAKIGSLFTLMCRMAQAWHKEDREAGRQTYFPPEEASTRYRR